MAVTIQTRRDDSADWTTANPVLALGEIGIETDTDKAKYGDGFTAWNDLDYWDLGADGGQLPAGTNGQVLRYGTSWEATSSLVVDDAGNVGIGTSAPGKKLELGLTDGDGISFGDRAQTGAFSIGTETTTLGFTSNSTYIKFNSFGNNEGDITFRANNSDNNALFAWENFNDQEYMRIDATGNVGIGTNAPDAKLDVRGNVYVASGNTFTSQTSGYFLNGYNDFSLGILGGGAGIVKFRGTTQIFETGGTTERMRIDSSGNLLVGATQSLPTSTPAQLVVSGIAAKSAFFTRTTGTSAGITMGLSGAGAVTANINLYSFSSDTLGTFQLQAMNDDGSYVRTLQSWNHNGTLMSVEGEIASNGVNHSQSLQAIDAQLQSLGTYIATLQAEIANLGGTPPVAPAAWGGLA